MMPPPRPPPLTSRRRTLARARTRAKRSKPSDVEAPAPRASFQSAGPRPSRGIYHRSRSPAARTEVEHQTSSHSATPSSCHPPEAVQAYGAPCQPAPRRGAARRRRCRGGAADVRAHRVPGVRGGGQRQRVRDPAVHGRHVDHHGAHRGHLLRRRHAHRLPTAVRLHPGQERVQPDDRDDGAGADAGVAQRRALLRLRLRRELLRAGQEPGGPAAGRGPARGPLGRGQVRGRAPLRGLRGGRRRRGAGGAARGQPPGHPVGRRRQRRAQGRPGLALHRRAVQLALRVHRQGQRDLDALRRGRRRQYVMRFQACSRGTEAFREGRACTCAVQLCYHEVFRALVR
uniref:Uncharacterized protein n=1 Tax=Zea mays TaxID=4577 RepID=A0A804MY12_MAIZE